MSIHHSNEMANEALHLGLRSEDSGRPGGESPRRDNP